MTDKQERILGSALELFANQGYNATPTSKIAAKAGVSEGLIFRHFGNKKGLLTAIMKEADRRITEIMMPVLTETDPAAVIRKTIELPFGVPKDQYDFWRLQFKLKWEEEYFQPDKMKPLLDKLTWAFTELEYKDPEREARLLSQFNDTISIELLRGKLEDQQQFKTFLLEKYKL